MNQDQVSRASEFQDVEVESGKSRGATTHLVNQLKVKDSIIMNGIGIGPR